MIKRDIVISIGLSIFAIIFLVSFQLQTTIEGELSAGEKVIISATLFSGTILFLLSHYYTKRAFVLKDYIVNKEITLGILSITAIIFLISFTSLAVKVL